MYVYMCCMHICMCVYCEHVKVIKSREEGNSDFSFMFETISPESIYYRWRVYGQCLLDSVVDVVVVYNTVVVVVVVVVDTVVDIVISLFYFCFQIKFSLSLCLYCGFGCEVL